MGGVVIVGTDYKPLTMRMARRRPVLVHIFARTCGLCCMAGGQPDSVAEGLPGPGHVEGDLHTGGSGRQFLA